MDDSTSGFYGQQPETPTARPKGFVQLRPSAEKYNPNSRYRPQRSPAVPEADLDTSKLAVAFPGFSECADIKPLSPSPFVTESSAGQKPIAPAYNKSLQPRVRDENDVSIISEPRPSLANIGKKNTRFSSLYRPKTRQGVQPHMYKQAPGLVQNAGAMGSAGEPKPMAINAHGSLTSLPNGSSQPTLNLPQGSNLTDLFSGIIRQPPPVNTQQARPRPSRFASASKTQAAAEPKAEEIPVPVDERQLLHSIDVLQNRVKELELEKKQLEGRPRGDSAVASSDEEGSNASHRKLADEKKRLESTCWALQDQQKELVREIDTAEKSIKSLEQDCQKLMAELTTTDSKIERLEAEKASLGNKCARAVAQLEDAFTNNDVLTQENATLRDENEKLKAQIELLTQAAAAKADLAPEQSRIKNDDVDDTTPEALDTSVDADDEGPLDMDTISKMNQQQILQPKQQQVAKHEEPVRANGSSSESSHNITYLSYAGDSSICKVRKTLEQERKARHQRRQTKASEEPSIRRMNERDTNGHQLPIEQSRQQSESSVIRKPKRRSTPRDELTSGFILPDITFNLKPATESQAEPQPVSNPQPQPKISQQGAAQDYTERSDLLDYEPVTAQEQPAQQTVKTHQLPTISDEELDITIHDEEPTIRPSQPPDVALAAVLESLNTELASQRAQMAKYQASYDRQDVSISRRQRKQIHAKIEALLQSIDTKADQIYNLHDVIEGQKKNGQPITQTQVDNTLQSLGLDLPWEGIESTNASRHRSTASPRSL
ncbi:MAG: hypothetical protein Q9201_003041 [Fulgogasparrea decipioides]